MGHYKLPYLHLHYGYLNMNHTSLLLLFYSELSNEQYGNAMAIHATQNTGHLNYPKKLS